MTIPTLARAQLIQRLTRALAHGHVFLDAPTGYGKTVLLQLLAQQRPAAYLLRLTPADIDQAVLQARLEPLLRAENTILLDDVQILETGRAAGEWLLECLAQPNPRWVLAGQRVPGDLSWLLAAGALERVPAAELAFTLAETRAVLDAAGGPPAATASQIHQHLAGWPIAVGLVARMPSPGDALLQAKERLFTYLAQRIFDEQPEPLRRFLALSAVPLRFDDALAEHLAGADGAAARREVQRRNLFLYEDEAGGVFRYHELFREFLLGTGVVDAPAVFERCVAWFEQRGDSDNAIEHALAGRQTGAAARLMEAVPYLHIYQAGRYLTYRRWLLNLSDADRAQRPVLLARAGAYLLNSAEYRNEGWRNLRAGLALANESGNKPAQFGAVRHLASAYGAQGDYDQAVALLQTLVDDPACQGLARLSATHNQAVYQAQAGHYAAARRNFQEAMRLAGAFGGQREVDICRANLATHVLIPHGRLIQAADIITQIGEQNRAQPFAYLVCLTQRADANTAAGDWPALAQTLDEARAAQARLETPDISLQLLVLYYTTLVDLHRGEVEAAAHSLEQAFRSAEIEKHPVPHILLAIGQTQLLRRREQHGEAAEFAEAFLRRPIHLPYFQARLALERDLALALSEAPRAAFEMAEGTRRLVGLRARADLVRLRMLLAVVCWRAGRPRWRRHFNAALWAGQRPGYQHLLTQRDPELSLAFWRLALMEGAAGEQTLAALAALGKVQPLLSLLAHASSPVRGRAAAAAARIGDEAAMPALADALAVEADPAARAALAQALAQLESQPPPRLEIRLLGGFRLRRGGEAIAIEAFPRPIVLRLLQYFALHHSQPLPRERILDDLWPNTPPAKAAATFRSVHSRLRKVLEPYMRPKGPSRYFAVEADAYRFDPEGWAAVDIEQFLDVVSASLEGARGSSVPPLPPALLAALSAWEPLLPELPAEDWLLPARQRVENAYVEGCLYAAQACLARGDPQPGASWAQRVIDRAPWLEEAYQALMRAHARQGQRTLALKVYAQAAAALAQELAVEPSALTHWLRARLERGEDI